MKLDKIKLIVEEEVKLQRKRLFLEQGNPMEPGSEPAPTDVPTDTPPLPAGQNNDVAALNKKKSVGIIVGALKTLFNSGAIAGIDKSHMKALATDMINGLDTQVQALGSVTDIEEPTTDGLKDDVPAEEASQEFDDAGQYDDDLSQQVPDPGQGEEAPMDEPEEEEPLFEAKDFKQLL